jgi:hypothetical protein
MVESFVESKTKHLDELRYVAIVIVVSCDQSTKRLKKNLIDSSRIRAAFLLNFFQHRCIDSERLRSGSDFICVCKWITMEQPQSSRWFARAVRFKLRQWAAANDCPRVSLCFKVWSAGYCIRCHDPIRSIKTFW